MVTIHREAGFRFVIFVDDHKPAHFHVFGAGEAKINLIGPDGDPTLIWAARQVMFLTNWNSIHG